MINGTMSVDRWIALPRFKMPAEDYSLTKRDQTFEWLVLVNALVYILSPVLLVFSNLSPT